MSRSHRIFAVTVAWTLALLFLGSVVHATESSLACPDWPTCFGTMFPEMKGGVFWEHLHRLVAGGLILLFGLATWFAYRDTGRGSWIRTACIAGIGLLLVQAVFGGLTVIYRLPDAISTSHLSMALAFLALATVLAAATSPRMETRPHVAEEARAVLRGWGTGAAALVFAQSVVGGVVRHTDAGMACPDFPTCIGEWVPPLQNSLVASHFLHRLVGVAATLAVVILAVKLARAGAPAFVRRTAALALALVAAQFTLGVVSVFTVLAVVPVSLHTLGAAALLSVLVLLAAWGRLGPRPIADARAESPAAPEA